MIGPFEFLRFAVEGVCSSNNSFLKGYVETQSVQCSLDCKKRTSDAIEQYEPIMTSMRPWREAKVDRFTP
jgi:hypothetical protein